MVRSSDLFAGRDFTIRPSLGFGVYLPEPTFTTFGVFLLLSQIRRCFAILSLPCFRYCPNICSWAFGPYLPGG